MLLCYSHRPLGQEWEWERHQPGKDSRYYMIRTMENRTVSGTNLADVFAQDKKFKVLNIWIKFIFGTVTVTVSWFYWDHYLMVKCIKTPLYIVNRTIVVMENWNQNQNAPVSKLTSAWVNFSCTSAFSCCFCSIFKVSFFVHFKLGKQTT